MILEPASENIAKAAVLLRECQCIGLPTETVYGLAADALSPLALAWIFEIKKRPLFDPLILHVPEHYELERLVAAVPEKARILMEKFWPGPLTLLLPKREIVPDLATSGLSTVALRCPDHVVSQAVLREFGGPLAAPSANRFGRISPTTAQAVAEELGENVPFVLDGGPCRIGVESTIVDASGDVLRLLRPGGIPAEEIEKVIGDLLVSAGDAVEAPGMLKSHYAPRTPLYRLDQAWSTGRALPENTALLCWSSARGLDSKRVRVLAPSGKLTEAAARLFQCLRELDGLAVEKIWVEPVPMDGLGRAINDRLEKASSGGAA
ncbi:MAG: L-threonylcarbamoyladenylate synthase [Methylacidiphilales bacterium]|nr:L-threonylcarbamoyladenylate synthase [Candidatus Methylacidiphilales bacterium]